MAKAVELCWILSERSDLAEDEGIADIGQKQAFGTQAGWYPRMNRAWIQRTEIAQAKLDR